MGLVGNATVRRNPAISDSTVLRVVGPLALALYGRVRRTAVRCAASAFGYAFPSEAIKAVNTMQIVVGDAAFAGKYSMTDRAGSHLVHRLSTGGQIEPADKLYRKNSRRKSV